MVQRIKKSLLVFFFTCFGVLYPFISLANWVDNLKKGIGVYILFIIVKLAVNIAKFFTGLSGSLLNWVLSPNFISYSYTRPGPAAPDNPIIETGLGVTQGFVNMLLVLVLVYIAIATILRLAGYETKKLLITFFIVALLVNFAPVICGVIVDASNIIMNFFVQDLEADAFATLMSNKVTEISAGFTDRTELESGWDQITQLAVMVPFLWVLTFILLLFTVIFILRYLVIWLLVILAPLAFACYILPITKKYWEMWWKQFIAWSFIGVTCGFFLYLGLLLVVNTQAGTAVPAPTTGEGGLFDSVLPYFVSAIFLGIGFVFGLQTSAIGASTVVNFAKTKGKAVAQGTKKVAWRGTKTATAGVAGAIKGAREGEGIKGRISGVLRGAATFEGREKGREGMGKILEKMHLVRPGTYEESRRKRWKVEEETKKMEKLSTDRLHKITQRKIVRPADRVGSIAAFEVLAKRRSLKDQEAPLLPKMQSFGADISEALKARPDWASLIGKNVAKQVAGTSTRDFTKNTQAEALKNIEVVASLDIPKIQHIGLRGKTEQKRALRQSTAPNSAGLGEIINKIDQLRAQGTSETNQEAERIVNIVAEIMRNLNFQS